MVSKVTSIRIEEEVWKRLKVHCVSAGIDIGKYLEMMINERLSKLEAHEKQQTNLS